MDDNRKKALAAALSQIEKQFGKGSVMRMGDNNAIRNIEAISTGSLSLDIALGIGGVPKGRVVEIYGPESSGKTTLTLHCKRCIDLSVPVGKIYVPAGSNADTNYPKRGVYGFAANGFPKVLG